MGQALSFRVVVASAALLAGCGSSSGNGSKATGDAGGGDDGGQAGGEAGTDSGGYPAFTVDVPQVQKNQGAVVTSPVIVTVTWPGETNASTWEAFDDAIGASTYWSATTAQYGVGPAKSGPANHVRMTQPLPPSISYTDVISLVSSALQAGGADGGATEAGATDGGAPNPTWPPPVVDASGHAQTIYSLFIPPSSAVTDPGSGANFCTYGALGYHEEATANGVGIPFAVTLECPAATLDVNEETAAHETVEAATNPYVESTTQGYVHFDADHVAWDLYTQFYDELSDVCQNWQDSYYQESAPFPYWVQRSWSNTAALAGHDPCAPAAAGAYHGMTLFPSQESTVTVDATALGGSKSSTKGFKATVGQPLTFQVGYFSDASAAPWTIAYDFPASLADSMGNTLSNGKATISIDKTTGQNGDEATVTVTVTTKAASGFHVMAITWDPPTTKQFLPHYLPLVIVDQ